ncbi:MAG: cardiolipin synthase [Spirochaetaceae bacterium]|jgi:cardiolipin synthase|nr:cardiolipin synthase [Spirochaetaceae bacterium]
MKKPGVKKYKVRLLSRARFFVAILIVLQLIFLAILLAGSSLYFRYAGWILHVISVVVSIHIFNRSGKSGFKLTWIFLILLFPLFGGIFYLVFYIQSNPRKYRILIKKYQNKCKQFFYLSKDKLHLLENAPCYRLSRYLQNSAGFPVYTNTKTEYFSSGEAYFKSLIPELEQAKQYIFLESFLIEAGIMFDTIFAVLEKKAKAGLDVRVMYDDLGCFATLPDDFDTFLEKAGIKCLVFNPFKPVLSSLQNNRDHRKIVSIDGKTAFTGGVNIGDEYINAYEKYGHWKDSAIMLKGEGAWSLTMIFLRLWNMESFIRKKWREDDYTEFFPWKTNSCPPESDGFVQPYADSPIIKEYICEKVYLHIINTARNYVYINTPYLIPDEAILSALMMSAKFENDIRIITPHRPDKPLVQMVTRSFYRQLISAGVKIYEYSAGFNHSKTFVSDDTMATVGTPNLNYRSLYLDYECAIFMYKNSSIKKIKEDFLLTIANCKEMTLKDCAPNAFFRLIQDVARLFAPLM